MVVSVCKMCGNSITIAGSKPAVFCNLLCKADWQRTQKPVNREWLYQKYVIERLGTYEIAKLVDRNPKRVYEWLLDYGIKTRTKREAVVEMNKRESIRKKRAESSAKRVISDETRRKQSESKAGVPRPNLRGEKNGMFGRTGEKSPSWKGGKTPKRQQVYSSKEWKDATRIVRKRDGNTCAKCAKRHTRTSLHIHHIRSFSTYSELRCDPNNLVLLCEKCHKWVHSKKNINKEFIIE